MAVKVSRAEAPGVRHSMEGVTLVVGLDGDVSAQWDQVFHHLAARDGRRYALLPSYETDQGGRSWCVEVSRDYDDTEDPGATLDKVVAFVDAVEAEIRHREEVVKALEEAAEQWSRRHLIS